MEIIVAVVVGAVIGWLASVIMKAKIGLLASIVVGIVGSSLGFWVAGLVGIAAYGALARWLVAVGGAMLLIAILRSFGVLR